LAGLIAASAFSGGCNDLLRRSIRDGIFTFISGGISSTFDRSGTSSLMNDLITGALFGGGSTSSTSGTGQ